MWSWVSRSRISSSMVPGRPPDGYWLPEGWMYKLSAAQLRWMCILCEIPMRPGLLAWDSIAGTWGLTLLFVTPWMTSVTAYTRMLIAPSTLLCAWILIYKAAWVSNHMERSMPLREKLHVTHSSPRKEGLTRQGQGRSTRFGSRNRAGRSGMFG